MKAAIWSPSLLWRCQGRGEKPPRWLGGGGPAAPRSPLAGAGGGGGVGGGGSSLALVRVLVSPLPPPWCCALTLQPLALQLGKGSPPQPRLPRRTGRE